MNRSNLYICHFTRLVLLIAIAVGLGSCKEYTAVQKTTDFEYRYEVAKACFMEGSYAKSASLLSDLVGVLKGTQYGEESLFLLAQAEYGRKDYESAGNYYKKYYQSYPRGIYVEQARYQSALSQYKQIPDVRLDQSATWEAIKEFQSFMDYYPYSRLKLSAQNYIDEMQDKLVEKEYLAAKLYFDLGSYMNNCAYGGSNYEACIITAQNALKDFPYASAERREQLAMMILRSRYNLAKESIEEKKLMRFRDTVDEYYSFVNDYPESSNMKEAVRIFKHSDAVLKNKHFDLKDFD